MIIDFTSRAGMKEILKRGYIDVEDDVVVSISDTPEEYLEMNNLLTDYFCYPGGVFDSEGWQKFTCLMFNDDEGDFSYLQARCIKSLVDNHGHKKNYVIHCFAGVSRSGAVAKWINEYFAAEIHYLNNYVGHNRHVFNTLHKTSGTSLLAYYEELEAAERKDPVSDVPIDEAVKLYFAEQCVDTLVRGVVENDEVAQDEVFRDLKLFIKDCGEEK